MEMDKELIDKLLGDYKKPEDIIGENGLLKQLTRATVGCPSPPSYQAPMQGFPRRSGVWRCRLQNVLDGKRCLVCT